MPTLIRETRVILDCVSIEYTYEAFIRNAPTHPDIVFMKNIYPLVVTDKLISANTRPKFFTKQQNRQKDSSIEIKPARSVDETLERRGG